MLGGKKTQKLESHSANGQSSMRDYDIFDYMSMEYLLTFGLNLW